MSKPGYVFKISLPGFDVEEASPEECAVHSDFVMPKIDPTKGNFISFLVNFNHEPTNPSVAGATVETIIYQREHGYNYTPKCWMEAEYTQVQGLSSFFVYGPGKALLGAVSAFDAVTFGIRCDSKYMYMYVKKQSSALDNSVLNIAGSNLRVRVYIFAEEGVDP